MHRQLQLLVENVQTLLICCKKCLKCTAKLVNCWTDERCPHKVADLTPDQFSIGMSPLVTNEDAEGK